MRIHSYSTLVRMLPKIRTMAYIIVVRTLTVCATAGRQMRNGLLPALWFAVTAFFTYSAARHV